MLLKTEFSGQVGALSRTSIWRLTAAKIRAARCSCRRSMARWASAVRVSLLPPRCMDLFGARAVASIIGTLYTGATLVNLLGPVVAGAMFDRVGSYGPVIWTCIGLSAPETMASARLIGPQPAAKAPSCRPLREYSLGDTKAPLVLQV